MRGRRGIIGDSLHAVGVRLGIAFGGSSYYPSEDRSILECVIMPFYQLSQMHQSIVFVGTDWYTHGYTRMFSRKYYTTIDPNPEQARYGAEQHIVDDVGDMGQYVSAWLARRRSSSTASSAGASIHRTRPRGRS